MEHNIIEAYGSYGALGASFIMLMAIVWKWVNSIHPALKSLENAVENLEGENQNYKEALDNNTKALEAVARSVEEVAKSNHNIATMVQMFSKAMEHQATAIEKHDISSSQKFDDAKDMVQSLCSDLKYHDKRGERVEAALGKLKGVVEIQTEIIKVSKK